jgi:low affinity Fe/Cu permease
MKKIILLLLFIFTSSLESQNVIVSPGKSITVEKTSSVTISGDLFNNGTVTLNSSEDEFSSIIVRGTSDSDIIYNRYVNHVGNNGWDLIGSPVDELSISSFVSDNTGALATNGSTYAIGYYDNSENSWTNYTSSSVGNTNFDLGKGYQMASATGSSPGSSGRLLSFIGKIATTDQQEPIQDNSGNSGTIWNLVSNPYPSYIYANNNANSTHNILKTNIEDSDNLHNSYAALYSYNPDGSYTIYNQLSEATYIAPGQGFMVASNNSSGGHLSITEAMQTTVGGDNSILPVGDLTDDSFELILKLFHGDTEIDYTRFYFSDGLTLGLDAGYDAGHFNQEASLMSRLVEEDQGIGFIINAMGLESINNVVIPLVINQEVGQNFRINLDTFEMYADTNVYLEDNLQGTMTLLNDEDFELTPQNNLSEMGRFFIHFTADTFSIDEEVSTNVLSVFKADQNNFITIEGLALQSGETSVKLYNVIGMEVLSRNLNNNSNTQTISTIGLASGVYIIQLKSGINQLTKKLIIK